MWRKQITKASFLVPFLVTFVAFAETENVDQHVEEDESHLTGNWGGKKKSACRTGL